MARYTDFLSVTPPNDPTAHGNLQLAGNTPPQAPTLSAPVGFEHGWPVPHGSLTGRIQTKLQLSENLSLYNFADTAQKGFTMSDALLTYAPTAEGTGAHWKLAA